MRLPETQADRALFAEIFDDPYRAADAVKSTLLLDGEPVDHVSSLVATSVAEAPAVALEATLPVSVSRRIIRREARVVLRVEGVRWVDFIGRVVMLKRNDDGSATVSASTPGYYQGGDDAVKFNEKTEYNHTPARALQDLLGRIPYSSVKIPPIQRPMYVRQRETAFPPVSTIGEAIEDLEVQAGIVQRDDWLSGGYARPLPTLGSLTAGDFPVWTRGEEVSAFDAELKNNGQFYDVGIVMQNPVTGDYEQLVSPRPKVRYDPGVPPPPRDVTYYEEVSGETAEGVDAVQAAIDEQEKAENVREKARTLAAAFSFGGEHNCSIGVPYLDPRIEEYDARDVRVLDHETGAIERWRVLIEGMAKDYITTSVNYTGTGIVLERREQEQVRRPVIRIHGSEIPEPAAPGGDTLMASSSALIFTYAAILISEATE